MKGQSMVKTARASPREKGRRRGFVRIRRKSLKRLNRRAGWNLDFVAPDLEIVAPGLEIVARIWNSLERPNR
jgi:hypothetical protein